MSDLNTLHNRTVWFDVPVRDLKRACDFYSAVLDIQVELVSESGFEFAVLEHKDGNGGCLVPNKTEVSATQGILVYFNVNGRIKTAVKLTELHGGKVLQDVHAIGPHGYRSLVLDSEGNRIALHSQSDN